MGLPVVSLILSILLSIFTDHTMSCHSQLHFHHNHDHDTMMNMQYHTQPYPMRITWYQTIETSPLSTLHNPSEIWVRSSRVELGCVKSRVDPIQLMGFTAITDISIYLTHSTSNETLTDFTTPTTHNVMTWHALTNHMLRAGMGPRAYQGPICSVRTRLQLMCCATRHLLSSNFGRGAGKGLEVWMRSLRDNQCRFQTEEHTWGSECISTKENISG